MFEIYTPGHNYLTDTLIMWGIVYIALDACDPTKSRVIGLGGRYRIVLEDFDESKFNAKLRDVISDLVNVDQLAGLIKTGKRRGLGKSVISDRLQVGLDNDTKNGVAAAIHEVLDSGLDLKVFAIDHIEKMKEGRLGKGLNLYIPFSGIYGKYLTSEHRYLDKPYNVCSGCILFSAIGFHAVMGIARKGGERIYSILGFDGEATLYDLSRLLRPIWYIKSEEILTRALRNNASLTRLGQVLVMYLEMPRDVREALPRVAWYMIMYSYDVGRTKRISGFQIFDLVPMRNIIERIEEEYDKLPRLIELLIDRGSIDKGGDEVINLLAEIALNRDLYGAFKTLRVLRSVIERIDEKKYGKLKKSLYGTLGASLASGLVKAVG